MQETVQKLRGTKRGRPRKIVKCQLSNQQKPKKQQSHDHEPQASQDDESQSEEESEVVELAIKSMEFRPKRGTKMKNLIQGKTDKDQFWEVNAKYFGGDLNKDQEPNQDDQYEASSSGRDEFDSDFNDTDSYVGKRGRKKGTKIRGRSRGRPYIKKSEPKQEEQGKEKKKRGRPKKNGNQQNKILNQEIKVEESKKQQKEVEAGSSSEIKKEQFLQITGQDKKEIEIKVAEKKFNQELNFHASLSIKNMGNHSQNSNHKPEQKSPLKKQEDAFISSLIE